MNECGKNPLNRRYCLKKNRLLQFEKFFFLCAMWAGFISPHAVLFYSTSDPIHNTTAPTGSLTNSGWQYEGEWNGFLGTAIAPRYFITAKHVGGSIGDVILNGASHVSDRL